MKDDGFLNVDTKAGLPSYLHVGVGNGAFMALPSPDPKDVGGLGWRLRYNKPVSYQDQLAAASILESYLYLVMDCTKKEAARRIKFLKASYRQKAKTSVDEQVADGEVAT